MKKKISLVLILCMLMVTGLSGCANTSKSDSEKPIVYASFFPIYDMVHQVAGDTVDLRTFMPTNTDPHLWEPTAKDMKELAKADILFVNGANMEGWVDKVAENLPNLKIVTLSDKVRLITYKGAAAMGDFQYMTKMKAEKKTTYKFEMGHTHEDIMRVTFIRNKEGLDKKELIDKAKKIMEKKGTLTPQKSTISVKEGEVYSLEMGHGSGRVFFKYDKPGDWYVVSDRISERLLPYKLMDSNDNELPVQDIVTGSTTGEDKITYDPHSWLSLGNAKSYLNYIYDVLKDTYGNEEYYKKNKFKAVEELTDIQAQYFEKFKALDKKNFMVTHYAWEYLAREYELNQYPLEGLVSSESPSLKTIRKAIDFCKFNDVNTIFYETNMPPREAETISQELDGGKFVDLNSMEYVQPDLGDEAGTYTKVMEQNLSRLYDALR